MAHKAWTIYDLALHRKNVRRGSSLLTQASLRVKPTQEEEELGRATCYRSVLSPESTCVWRSCYPWMFPFALHILSWFPGFTTQVMVLVAQSCPTVCDSMNFSLSGFSVHGILQVRILEWAAIPFFGESSWPRDRTRSPALQTDSLPSEPPGKPLLLHWWCITL